MRLRDKILIAVLGFLIFGVSGAIACTYYSTYVIDLISVVILGILVFVTAGVVVCSRNNSRIAKPGSN